MPVLPTSRHLAVGAVLPVLLLAGGCAGHGTAAPHGPAPAASPAGAARPAPLEGIAAALGCTPEVTVDADEVREGACGTGPESYRMATFTTEAGRTAWLTEARMYGGTYLVGPTWVITAATAEALAPAHTRLGGTLESGTDHTSPNHTGHTGQTPAPQDPSAHPAH
ncbi:hypothetical protein AB0F11_23285 [Streptomyces sp. NPDC032472]|uniref:hypothetical protein n=1 Tax=Streptomyces sp. NPDC032472 TaxID=3155018 RepID=UPI0033D26F08